jgi:thiamine-phosphate pyrophosphorylase
MRSKNNKYLRIIDANYNRAKEGLRVVEDIFRFIDEDNTLRIKIRAIRHGLNKFISNDLLIKAVSTRDSSHERRYYLC